MLMDKDDLPIGVNMILLNDKDEVLLGKRCGNRPGSGCWSLIGGKLKRGESIEETATRELFEELGITVANEDVHTINFSTSIDSDGTQFILVGTVVNNWQGEIQNKEDDKCEELKFFALDALPDKMFYATKSNLDLFIAGLTYDPYFNTNCADLDGQSQG